MSIKIEFIEGISEINSPIIKLTKSRNGETGTATFVFINPKIFEIINNETLFIKNLTLNWEEKKISTNDLEVVFQNGKPFLIKAIFIFKNSKEWFDFLNLINFYSKEIGLSFSKKTF
jgi:photosystem II protein